MTCLSGLHFLLTFFVNFYFITQQQHSFTEIYTLHNLSQNSDGITAGVYHTAASSKFHYRPRIVLHTTMNIILYSFIALNATFRSVMIYTNCILYNLWPVVRDYIATCSAWSHNEQFILTVQHTKADHLQRVK